jgi:hypothetical protein
MESTKFSASAEALMATSARLSRVIEGFLYAKEAQGRAEGTILDYKINLKRFCDYLGDPPIGEITSEQISVFFHWLQKDYTVIACRVIPRFAL